MSIEEMILEKLRGLPPEKQQEVLDFAQFLEHKSAPSRPLRSLKRLWAGLDIRVTEDDIAEVRREMWGSCHCSIAIPGKWLLGA